MNDDYIWKLVKQYSLNLNKLIYDILWKLTSMIFFYHFYWLGLSKNYKQHHFKAEEIFNQRIALLS